MVITARKFLSRNKLIQGLAVLVAVPCLFTTLAFASEARSEAQKRSLRSRQKLS